MENVLIIQLGNIQVPKTLEVRKLLLHAGLPQTICIAFTKENRFLYFWNFTLGCCPSLVPKKFSKNFMQLECIDWMF